MGAQANAPIIIKRKKVSGGDGHHGGAWKVAYADFVTAMMAFFMLMWLLNATTEQQRKGIADYFTPTASINRISGGGDGMFGGSSIFTQEALAENGSGASPLNPGDAVTTAHDPSDADAAAAEMARTAALQSLEQELLGRGGESTVAQEALRHIVTRVTDEGLIIEIFDIEGASLFEGDTDTPTQVTQQIAAMLSNLLAAVENDVAITAHLRARSVVERNNQIWDLSMSRAARMRLMLEAGGFDPARLDRLTGAGDRDPVVRDTTAPRNNRIEVIVLRSD